jgi:hypothetical protein
MSLKIQNYNGGNYDDRVARGKQAEAEIVAELIAEGHHIVVPSEKTDMYDKIDAYVRLTPALIAAYPVFAQFERHMGRLIPIQIKQRTDSYPDFDYELYTDRWEKRNSPGRERKSKACIMICRSRGTKAAASMRALRKVAESLYKQNPEAFTTDAKFELRSQDGNAILKRVEDKGSDNKHPFWKTILYYKKPL